MPVNSEPDIHQLVICANVFIRKGDKYLVLRRSPHKRFAAGVVHPVGGKVELDEDPYVGALREVREETGLAVKNMRLEAVLNEILPPPDFDRNWIIYHFSADYDSGEVIQTDEGELVWLSAEEIRQDKLFPSVRMIIEKILDPAVGTVFTTFEWDGDQIVKPTAVINQCAR
jgi:8-oxo-dGTP diphosphatase